MDFTTANVAVSPYSAINAIVTLAQAANGESLHQIKEHFHIPNEKSDLIKAYATYNDLIKSSAGNLTFMVANKVFVQDGYPINKQFQEIATHKLASGVGMVNFLDAKETAGVINNFVVEKTNNTIRDIIQPTSFSHIVLIDAVHMRVAWKCVYESINIEVGEFYGYPYSSIKFQVDFMQFNYRHKFNFTTLPNLLAKVLEIKMFDSDFSLLLILPDSWNNIRDIQSKNYDLRKIVDQMREEFVDVKIPKFKIKHQISLKDIMKKVVLIIINGFGM